MLTSVVLHVLAMALMMLMPAAAMHKKSPKELDVVFYRPRPKVDVRQRMALPPGPATAPAGPKQESKKPSPPVVPHEKKPTLGGPERPDLLPAAPGTPSAAELQQQRVGKAGILAFRDKFASLSRDKVAPRLGADARFSAADDVGKASARSVLTAEAPGSSGGINTAS